jgi:signal transduction histidine kinase
MESAELEKFYADLGNGLHAMAQPLTILRSAVVACTLPNLPPADHRRYLDISAEQVERACGLFQSLQQLVITRQTEAANQPIDIAELLAPVVEAEKEILEAAGLQLQPVMAADLPLVSGDKDRTLQAIFAALKIAVSISSSGGVIELLVLTRGQVVEITIQNLRSHGTRLNSSDRLELALSEANMRSQRGHFSYFEDPFSVSMMLPLQDADPQWQEELSSGVRAHQVH